MRKRKPSHLLNCRATKIKVKWGWLPAEHEKWPIPFWLALMENVKYNEMLWRTRKFYNDFQTECTQLFLYCNCNLSNAIHIFIFLLVLLVAAVIHRLLLCRATFSYPGSQQLWVWPQSSFRDFKLVFALNRHSRARLCWYETLIRHPETEAAAFGYTDSYQSLVAFLLFSGDIKGVCPVCWCHSDTDSFWQGRRDERTKARACLSPF